MFATVLIFVLIPGSCACYKNLPSFLINCQSAIKTANTAIEVIAKDSVKKVANLTVLQILLKTYT
jgi:hypothetical protein